MYRFQTLTKEQLTNAILCFADRISCDHCPCKEDCLSSSLPCEDQLMYYLTAEIEVSRSFDYFDGFNAGYDAGYGACKKAIIDKLQKGRGRKA